MNAKKIMGAVLVALLAAALFVGAGAAVGADPLAEFNGKTVFVYQEVAGLAGTTWNNGANSITFDATGVVSGNNIVEGPYVNGEYTIYVKYPTAAITAIANNNSVKYPVIGGTFYSGTTWLNLTITSPAGAMIDNLLITFPDGTQKKAWDVVGLEYATAWPNGILTATPNPVTAMANGTVELALNKTVQDLIFTQTGTYKIQAIFNVSGAETNAIGMVGTTEKPLVDYIPDEYRVAKDVYSVTFVDEKQEVTISASVDKVLAGKTFTVTITGMPGKNYVLDAEDDANLVIVSAAGANTINKDTGAFTMPNGGSITVYVKSSEDDEVTLIVKDTDAEVTIEILEATLTATIGAPSYFIGNKIEVTLTTDGELADDYKFNITGTNFPEIPIDNETKEGKTNVYELNTATLGKKLDVGTYTIKIYSANKLVATVPVALKQPFISIVEAPEVVVQGDKAEFIINAEATGKIQYYVFGTNYFLAGNTSKNVDKDTKNQFVVTLTKDDTSAKNMSTGQYFAVFQHSMYDGLFNINATEAGSIQLYSTTKAQTLAFDKVLFNVSDRQTANAAQALCDALDSQNIDDMYVKASFFVVGEDESFTISEIPTEVAQGETFTISGVSTAAAGDYVTVEMISTAFAAVPKETVGSAAFIAVSTKVADDGTWEITMDTSDLNVDEYSLKVAVTPANGGETETWKNVEINVVEAADEPVTPPTDEPGQDEPGQDEPVAPETPGFGALAALAGLGAVAVLLLRRE